MTSLIQFFSATGALAKRITGYAPRRAQLDMAIAVEKAIADQHHLIAEAGTGTGKTFAYLVPAILSDKKVIVSTGTKNLQDQLISNDIPVLRAAIHKPFSVALLKGRNNYLCSYRLENALTSAITLSREEAKALGAISRWAKSTQTGDKAEVANVSENDAVWYHATSSRENCLGADCDYYDNCFLMKARKKAQDSDVIIVNHHLLCADWSLREGGYLELLPNAEVIIIDEAHQLAQTAAGFLGVTVTAKQLGDLADDALRGYFAQASDHPDLRSSAETLTHTLKEVRLVLEDALQRSEWTEITRQPRKLASLVTLNQHLQTLTQQLKQVAVKSKELELLSKRADTLNHQLDDIINQPSDKWVRWYETHKKTFSFHKTPLNITPEFQAFMQAHPATWIFTSATLSIAGRFDYFAANLGLMNAPSHRWDSPFDYPNQALFYHPKGLPQPNAANFTALIVEFAVPVLRASQGRAFFLFTSHKALQEAASLLAAALDYPLLIQGTRPKALLLEEFKQLGNAILLGTASFWEGVDVRGEALSCVIIDKLPFASPSDPVLKAQLNALTEQGRNAFFEQQLPSAVIALRQGVGRLIRDSRDKGVFMICDPRLLKRSYGQLFLDSLPPMRRTRDIADVQKFFS